MTCIVGLEHFGKVYMAGDSAGGNSHISRVHICHKVFIKGSLIIGFEGSIRMGQLLETMSEVPSTQARVYPRDYLIKDFIPYVQKLFKDNGFSTLKDNVETGGYFLVGLSGELYEIQEDYSLFRTEDGFNAIGSGENYALGAMHAAITIAQLNSKQISPEELLVGALKTTAHFSPFVKPPFEIESI